MSTTFSLGETLRLRFLKDTFKTDFVEESVLLTPFMRLIHEALFPYSKLPVY